MTAPLDRLAELVAGMTARPWVASHQCIDQGASHPDGHRLVSGGNDWGDDDSSNLSAADCAGVAALRNIADELIAIARAADGLKFMPGKELRPLRVALYRLDVKLEEIR